MSEETRPSRKTFQGVVVSDKMDKTRVIRIERQYKHPKYSKVIRVSDRYYAHDEGNTSKLGDLVEIMSTRPLSKLKRWRVTRVITAFTV
ncbi:MAG: 30S ribosomal protein S17 [Elusimicrobiaceae bacterium]